MTNPDFSTYMKNRKKRHQSHINILREGIDQVIRESNERFRKETAELMEKQQPSMTYKAKLRESHKFRRALLQLLADWTPKTLIPELAKVKFECYTTHVVFHIDIPLDMTYEPTGEIAAPDEGCIP